MSHDADEAKVNKRRRVTVEEKTDDFFKESDFYLGGGIQLSTIKAVTKRANELLKEKIQTIYICRDE